MINVNRVDDDVNNLANSSLNQKQNVLASGTATPTTISSINSATGSVASPGPAGFGGDDRPGRRIYNPLSKLSSYTYNFTLYMITPDAHRAFIDSGRKNINAFSSAGQNGNIGAGAYIIAQSGGINNTTSKRAPGFELDVYIDNVKFTTMTNTKATDTSNAAISEFEFQIIEPFGFSFLSNLRKTGIALYQYNSKSQDKDIPPATLKAMYVLGIRFYGYDKNGNLVKPDSKLFGETIDPYGTSGELYENFYDLQLTDITFKLDGKTTVYSVKAISLSSHQALSTKRARIPTGANVEGNTVEDMLIGQKGLFSILNKQQLDLVKNGNQKYVNTYEINWVGDAASAIGSQSTVTASDLDKWRWGGSGSQSTTDSTDAKNNTPPNNNTRQLTFNNDTAIMSAIEQIIKKSAFMEDALKAVYANVKQPDPKDKNTQQVKTDNPSIIRWFTISTEILDAQWDDKLADWAYTTIYNISTYEVPSLATPYGDSGNIKKYYGPHKRYEYWFTGKNTEILDFSMQFDGLYYNAVLGIPKTEGAAAQDAGAGREGQEQTAGASTGTSSTNTKTTSASNGLTSDTPPSTAGDNGSGNATSGGQTPATPGLRTGGDKSGGLGVTLEAQNQIQTYLNDPGAYASGVIKILGDPDFLVRDAVTSVKDLYSRFYDTDGYTISCQGGQVFIEIAFREARDYSKPKGVMDLNENFFLKNYPPYIRDITKGAVIWMVNSVQSTFSNGRFEQVLNLISPDFTGTGSPIGPLVSEDPNFENTNTNTQQTTNGTADDDAAKPKTTFEQQLSKEEQKTASVALPPPKMSTVAPTIQSSTQSILQNKDNFGRPVTINTFGQ